MFVLYLILIICIENCNQLKYSIILFSGSDISSSRAKFLVKKEIGIFSRYFLPENYKSSESPSFSKENI